MKLEQPVFVVGAPEAGSAAVVAALARASGVWRSSGPVLEEGARAAEAGAGAAADGAALREALAATLVDREGARPGEDAGTVRAVAGGAALTLAVPLLAAAFPDARFVLVAPGDDAPPEAHALAASARGSLQALDATRRHESPFARLVAEPREELSRICAFAGIEYDQALLSPLEALSRATARAGATSSGSSPLASAHTTTLPERLRELSSSLLVSTYQTGKLVCARERDGTLNTHFRDFDKPMGIAVAPGRFALGTRTEVWDLRDVPEAAPKVEPEGTHDACYLPRNRHVTGDIAIHEMGFAGGELWIVATAFSCLATLDAQHSFVPRWKPPFVSALAPGDRCHLNGMAIVGDRVRYVTALGRTDEPGAWRAGKADGGVLLEVPSGEVVVAGLSMPHSPRRHRGRLFVLESGRGALCVVDEATGRAETVAELPGFTRGLAFSGTTAFVGLSQIRESSTFGDLPLTKRLRERQCGVWMVDVTRGTIDGFLRFDDLVQEVFDVALLQGKRFPEIAEPRSSAVATSYVLP